MARPLRLEYDGAVYHITSRGNARKPIYKEDEDREKPHPCLTIDWILGQFGSKRRQSEKKYSEFVMAGLGEEKIWKDVKGQSILGEDEFIKRFLNLERFQESTGQELLHIGLKR